VQRFYPVYFEPLPPETQSNIREKAKKEGVSEPGEGMYWVCFNTARENKAASRRISDFLNLYGLCRNLSFTAAVSAIILIGSAFYWDRASDLWWAGASVFLSAGMLLRYLKFYRHYALEVFTCYAFTKTKSITKPKPFAKPKIKKVTP
jgi:hypothetical protein